MKTKKVKPRSKGAMKKALKIAFSEAKMARGMREDVASEKELKGLDDAVVSLSKAFEEQDHTAFTHAENEVAKAIDKLYPSKNPRMREYVEMFVVAIAIAMGLRTYFIQPFKIPTGSMQPTLYGITVSTTNGDGTYLKPGMMDTFPLAVIKYLGSGRSYKSVSAKFSGYVNITQDQNNRKWYATISRAPGRDVLSRHRIYHPLKGRHFKPGQLVKKGDLLWQGEVVTGDHILVNKMKYHFFPPKRGEVIVFSTQNTKITDEDTYYIKRLIGLPGETVSLGPSAALQDPEHGKLYINGEEVTSPEHFQEWEYEYGGRLSGSQHSFTLAEKQYTAFGDNIYSSSDGRIWGSFPEENLLGPAFTVYWPFWKRFGSASRSVDWPVDRDDADQSPRL
jgi:signal peptidase I